MTELAAFDIEPRRRSAPHEDQTDLQRKLAHWNRRRLAPSSPSACWAKTLREDLGMQLLEGAFIEKLRRLVAPRAAAAPSDPDGFLAWFEALETNGPGQHDPLFQWIAEEAEFEELA
jgi:hypothetical protein